jgi:hypothetical protein
MTTTNVTLTIKQWEELFHIDGVQIVDEMEWHPYALNEGLANDDTSVRLSVFQIAKLSPLKADKIEQVISKL